MPTSRAVTVSTVTLSMASTHFSRVFIQTLAVVTIAVASADQTLPVGIIAHAAAAVTGACVGANYTLGISAQVFAGFVGEGTFFLVLTGFPKPVLIAETLSTVTHSMISTRLSIICWTEPVMAFTSRSIERSGFSDLTYANPTFTLASPTTDQPVGGPTAPQ